MATPPRKIIRKLGRGLADPDTRRAVQQLEDAAAEHTDRLAVLEAQVAALMA